MKLVWHALNHDAPEKSLEEADWLRYLLGDLVESEIVDLDLTCTDDDTIHVVGAPLPRYDQYFEMLRARCRHLVLLHISDEYLLGPYRIYRHFDNVLRVIFTYLAAHPGIMTIPLGYPNGTVVAEYPPADQRRYVWSFAGGMKSSRYAMAAALEGLQPSRLINTNGAAGERIDRAKYNELLAETVFSPCPMGNVILESWRLYESLERGCIPLLERRIGIDYFRNLYGPNPLPLFRNWQDARQYCEALLPDTNRLLRTQAELNDWWRGTKVAVRQQVRAFVTGRSFNAELQRFAALPQNRLRLLFEPLRLAELVRHQSPDTLRSRLMNPAGPIKRILSGKPLHYYRG